MSSRKTKAGRGSPRKRLPAEDRKEQIVAGAARLFSEHGFECSTYQLAQSLGVTQPLIYRHFPSKDDLVTAVYERVFLREWKLAWDRTLTDRSIDMETRLATFYCDYTRTIFEEEWIRIYLFSGLKRLEINQWYVSLVEERVLSRIGSELRVALGFPPVEEHPLTSDEIEALWLFHGGIFYYGVRRQVYGVEPKVDATRAVELLAGAVVSGMRTVLERIDWSARRG